MSELEAGDGPIVRARSARERAAAAELLDEFNRAYYHPSPGPAFLAERLDELDGQDLAAFLAEAPEGERERMLLFEREL